MEHIGLVKSQVAKIHITNTANLEFDDLVQVGCIGLMEAGKRYNPEMGAFSTYAVPWIKKYIYQEIENNRRTIRVPRAAREKATKEGTPYLTYGAQITEDMVSTDINMDDELHTKLLYQQASKAILQKLDAESQQIIRLRYIKDESRRKVAKIMGYSVESIRTKELKALAFLREELDKGNDDE